MRHWIFPIAVGALILTSRAGIAGPMQEVVPGIYTVDRQRSDDPFKAIEAGIANLPVSERPLARMRLRKSIAVDRIRISRAENQVGILYDAKAPIVVFIGAKPIKWKLIESLVFYVSAEDKDGAISMTYQGVESERKSLYRSIGQDLVEETVFTSPFLSAPAKYRIIYRRST